jgi:hypothetical protein
MQWVTRRASSDGRGAPPMMSSRRGMCCQDTNTRLTFSLSVAFTTTLPSTWRYLTSRRVCKWGKRWCERNGLPSACARSETTFPSRRLDDDLVSLRLPGETHRVRCGREHGLHGLRKHGPLLDQHFLLVRLLCCDKVSGQHIFAPPTFCPNVFCHVNAATPRPYTPRTCRKLIRHGTVRVARTPLQRADVRVDFPVSPSLSLLPLFPFNPT